MWIHRVWPVSDVKVRLAGPPFGRLGEGGFGKMMFIGTTTLVAVFNIMLGLDW